MIRNILEEHLDEAEDLFERRQLAFSMLDMTMGDLADMDARLRAHLDGFLLGGTESWELVRGYLKEGSKGQLFTAAVFAFESYDESRVEEIIKALEQPTPKIIEGIGWACRMTTGTNVVGFLRHRLNSESPEVRAMALDALVYRRVNPGEAVDRALASSDKVELIAGLNVAGMLRDSKYKPIIQNHLANEDSQISGAALLALVLHAPEQIADTCRIILSGGGTCTAAAANLLGIVGNETDYSLLWKMTTSDDYETAKASVLAFGNLGYPAVVPALIKLLEHPKLVGVAGVSLQRIFGEIAEIEEVQSDDELDEEETDDMAEWHPDDDLPKFAIDSVNHWWSQNVSRFPANTRFRDGIQSQAGVPNVTTAIPLGKLDDLERVLLRQ